MSRSLAQGTIFIMASEFVFILSNYAIHIGIARWLGVEAYGVFGVLLSLFMINRSFLNTGFSEATSKFVAEKPAQSGGIMKISWTFQFWMALVFMLLYLLGSPWLARFLKDPALTKYIILIGVMILPLAMLSLYTNGFMNGLRLFKEQALIKTIYPLLRFILTLLLIFLGWGIFGALIGYLLAMLLGVIGSIYLLRKHNIKYSDDCPPGLRKKLILFAIPVALSSLSFSLLRNINTLFIKYFLADNAVIGLYTAAYTISTVPYFVLISLSLTLTPAISNATAAGNLPLVRKYIGQSLRSLLLILVPGTLFIAATSTSFLAFFYSKSYVAAAPLLSILIIGSAFLTLFTTLVSVTTGGGKPWIETALSFIFMLLLSIFNILFIPRYGLLGSSYAVLVTSFLAFLGIAIVVYKKYGTLGNFKSYVNIIVVSSILFYFARWWQVSGWFLLVEYVVLGLLYLLLLYLFGELRQEDWQLVRKVMRIKS